MSQHGKRMRRLLSGKQDQNFSFEDLRAICMMKYEIILFCSEVDGAYIAEVPELAGCMADGKTPGEAVRNAEQVVAEWLETARMLGREIPVPRGRLRYA